MSFIAQQRQSRLYLSSPTKPGQAGEVWMPVAERSGAHHFPSRQAARETVSRVSGGRLEDYKITRLD